MMLLALVLAVLASPREVKHVEDLIDGGHYQEAIGEIHLALRHRQNFENLTQLRRLMDEARFGLTRQEGTVAAFDAYLEVALPGPSANHALQLLCELGGDDPDFLKTHVACGEPASPEPLNMLSFGGSGR